MKLFFVGLVCTLFLVGCEDSSQGSNPEEFYSEFEKQNLGSNASEPGLNDDTELKQVQIGDQTFLVEIADTQEERRKGLMFRKSLDRGTGMLFVFPHEKRQAFWMKNTFIPLDIIWISSDMKVIDVKTMLACKEDPCPNFAPLEKAKYVLEVNAREFEGEVGQNMLIK